MSRLAQRKRPTPSLRSDSVPLQKPERSLIPFGMTAILPHTAQRVRHVEDVLIACLARWGYQEVIPPTFEYLDVLSAGLEPDLIEKCFKFADRTTGRILLLRPDVTAQIARIVAMGMVKSSLPLRLSYRTTVFRSEPVHAGREQEIFQVGAELIGVDDVETDGEIIALMIECLRQLGIPEFRISLGHVGFFKGLLVRSGLSPEGQKRAEQAAARKDIPRLEEILKEERIPRARARAILEAPGLYGRDEVLERGQALAGHDRALRLALERLTRVYRLLTACGLGQYLLLDLGEFRGFDYYDGVVFDVFADGIGCELGGGGRYNHLIGRFGRDLPSTGFAFDVDRLFRIMERVEHGAERTRADFLVWAPPEVSQCGFQVAQMLRDAGYRVVLGSTRTSGAKVVASAVEEGRVLGVSSVVIVGIAGLGAEEGLLVTGPLGSLPSGRSGKLVRKKVKLRDLAVPAGTVTGAARP